VSDHLGGPAEGAAELPDVLAQLTDLRNLYA
jgi:hypothetical protein